VPLNILLLTHRIPYPLLDGGALVTNFMLQGFLNQGESLSLLSLNTSKHFVDVNTLPDYYAKLQHFETVNINNDVTPIGAIKNLFTSQSYHTARFASNEFNEKLKQLLQNNLFDFVVLDNIFLQDCIATIRMHSLAKIACRIHNIEHQIWQKLASNSLNITKKKYLQLQAKRLKKIELLTLQKVDILLLLNESEGLQLAEWGVHTKQYFMPFGININNVDDNFPFALNQCFHLASMNWLPNIEALDWFIAEVFPKIIQQNNNFVLHIGGKFLPEKYYNLQSTNIIVHPIVKDAKVFMQQHGICIVPLKSGAGIRVKILEAMANRIPVVSTSLGANGLRVKDAHNILLADDAQRFADAVCTNQIQLQQIAQQALLTMQQLYNANIILQQTIQYFNTTINAKA
jgi:polysaccharide biosynthesis protein PslH